MKLFVYGTLLDFDVLQHVCGRTLQGIDAQLENFSCRIISGEVYPGIVPAQGERVTGKLYSDVSEDLLSRLDFYEGELYERWQVVASVDGEQLPAEVYVLRAEFRYKLSDQDWSLRDFLKKDKAEYLREL